MGDQGMARESNGRHKGTGRRKERAESKRERKGGSLGEGNGESELKLPHTQNGTRHKNRYSVSVTLMDHVPQYI